MAKSILGTLVALGVCIFLSSCVTAPTEIGNGDDIYSRGIDYDPVKLSHNYLNHM